MCTQGMLGVLRGMLGVLRGKLYVLKGMLGVPRPQGMLGISVYT